MKKIVISLILFLLISCMDPVVIRKDCAGVIDGGAVLDECNLCTGGSTGLPYNYLLGCDRNCEGVQYDCEGECGGTKVFDCNGNCLEKTSVIWRLDDCCSSGLFNECDPSSCHNCSGYSCDGIWLNNKDNFPPEWNSSCKGCTVEYSTCYDSLAIVFSEGSCNDNIGCPADTNNTGVYSINSFEIGCGTISEGLGPCGPGTDCSLLSRKNENEDEPDIILHEDTEIYNINYDPQNDIQYTRLNCFRNRCIDNLTYEAFEECNPETACVEFNYSFGNCVLIDCLGVAFDNDWCSDTLITPDVYYDFAERQIISGCINGNNTKEIGTWNQESEIFTPNLNLTSLSSMHDTLSWVGYWDSTLQTFFISKEGILGDGECDRGTYTKFEEILLDFNCIEYNYDNGDCMGINSKQNTLKSTKKYSSN